jgi:2,4-dienoyl-CoA reductase (NADPH2)
VPVHLRGRIVPNYAMIDHDEQDPVLEGGREGVHAHDCKFILH